MARTETGATLTRQHRNRQLRLRAATLQDLMVLFPAWRGDRESFEMFAAATVTLTQSRRRSSAGLAGEYVQAFRTAEGVRAGPLLLDAGVDPRRVTASLYVTGDRALRRALDAGFSPDAARRTAQTAISGAVTRHVLDGGRETVLISAEHNRQSLGWMRVTGGNPCAWCAMHASRGPVFRSRESAMASRPDESKTHDHCVCTFEEMFEGSQMPPESERLREKWDQAQREAADAGELDRDTSNDALNAFRRFLNA